MNTTEYRRQTTAGGRCEAYRKLRNLTFHAIARKVNPPKTVNLTGYPSHEALMADHVLGYSTD